MGTAIACQSRVTANRTYENASTQRWQAGVVGVRSIRQQAEPLSNLKRVKRIRQPPISSMPSPASISRGGDWHMLYCSIE